MGSNASRVRLTGPLTEYAAGFASELERIGYTENATADQLRLLAHLSRWLDSRCLSASSLTVEVGDEFLSARRAAGYRLWLSRKGIAPLMLYLREVGAIPLEPPVALTATEAVLERFREFLLSERGLGRPTARGYVDFVRPFLRTRTAADGNLRLEDLTARDVTEFLVVHLPGRPLGSARLG